jgi:hypothetical protein
MANTPKALRKVAKTGAASVRAGAKGKDPLKVKGAGKYMKAVTGTNTAKAVKYDKAMIKGQDKQQAKLDKKPTKNYGKKK